MLLRKAAGGNADVRTVGCGVTDGPAIGTPMNNANGFGSAAAQLMEGIEQVTERQKNELTGLLNNWLHEQHAGLVRNQNCLPDRHANFGAIPGSVEPMSPSSITELPLPVVAQTPFQQEAVTEAVGMLSGTEPLSPLIQSRFTQEGSQREQVKQISSSSAADIMASQSQRHSDMHLKQSKTIVMTTVASGIGKKKSRGRAKKGDFLFGDAQEAALADHTWLQRVTDSNYYEWFSGSLIIVNALFLGWQTQHAAESAQDNAQLFLPRAKEEPAVFLAFSMIFTILFVVELAFRWVAEGFLNFFIHTRELGWHVLDVAVVFFSVLDSLMEIIVLILDDGLDGASIIGYFTLLRVLRIVRIVRIARVIRVMSFFRELRMMVFSILGCAKALLWVVMVLAVMFYVFGICFTAATLAHLTTSESLRDESNAVLFQSFGTLDRSMLSLYMAMSGGNDWAMYYDAMKDMSLQYRVIFLLFITFALFAVVNIVTGVFVDAAMKASTNDREVVVHEELETKKIYLESMRTIFEEMDIDGSGCVSIQEFEKRLDDERVIAYFNSLKLDISDARTVFKLLDCDHSGEVNIDEFLSGCYRLQGESRSLDMKIMQYQVKFLSESFEGLFSLLTQDSIRLDEAVTQLQKTNQTRHEESMKVLTADRDVELTTISDPPTADEDV